uniref:Ig-like domain-containing protein n=1 Tax=Ornithorhynchus anatinus TaxID=9258 RepID=A0A6I8MXJ4_ORNAN
MSWRSSVFALSLVVALLSVRDAASQGKDVLVALGRDFSLEIEGFSLTKDMDVNWYKNEDLIAKAEANQKPRYFSMCKIRCLLNPNGTLRVKNLTQEDGHKFTIQIFNKIGTLLKEQSLTLKPKEPVSKPNITMNCTTGNLICRVTAGWAPWMKILVNNKLVAGPVQNRYLLSSTLKEFGSLTVICYAWNNVSSSQTLVSLCSDSEVKVDIFLILSACGAGIILVAFLTLLVACVRQRRRDQRDQSDDKKLEMAIQRFPVERKLPQPPNNQPQAHPQRQPRKLPPIPENCSQITGRPLPRPPPPPTPPPAQKGEVITLPSNPRSPGQMPQQSPP